MPDIGAECYNTSEILTKKMSCRNLLYNLYTGDFRRGSNIPRRNNDQINTMNNYKMKPNSVNDALLTPSNTKDTCINIEEVDEIEIVESNIQPTDVELKEILSILNTKPTPSGQPSQCNSTDGVQP